MKYLSPIHNHIFPILLPSERFSFWGNGNNHISQSIITTQVRRSEIYALYEWSFYNREGEERPLILTNEGHIIYPNLEDFFIINEIPETI